MARIEFMDFNGEPMSTVKSVITEGAILKPLDFELSESSPYSSDFPWEDPNATVSLIEATTNENFALIGWDVDESSATYLQSFSVDMNTLASKILGTSGMKNLVVDNLTVRDNTKLGDNPTEDTVTISATVVGLNCNANFSGGTVTATHFVGDDFSGTTVSATTGKFTTLEVGGQPYRPFIIQSTAPTGGGKGNYLWINTSNNAVPVIMYTASADPTSDADWHPLGAVFG